MERRAQAVAKRHMEIMQQTMAELSETMRALASAEAPQAKAATACAPPMQKARLTPATWAAASTSGFFSPRGVGTTMMISATPATCAGIAFISTLLG